MLKSILGHLGNLFSRTGSAPAWVTLNESGAETGGMSDPYGLSPWVQRAIKHISGPVSSVPLRFSADGGKSDLSDPLLDGFWNRPAKAPGRGMRLSRTDTMEATVGWLCLAGEFFWILDDTWQGRRSAAVSPLVIARPDKMRAIVDDGELIGWAWTDGGGTVHSLIPENVVSSSFWNPADDIRGAAPMRAAELAAGADYAAARFWKSLAESNGDLGETVIAPNGVSPEQVEQIKMSLRRKRAAAKKGRYEPMFIVGDLKTEAPHIQSPDASAAAQRLSNRHEVFIAFGVPPSFAEVTASYSVGSASDRYKLIEETCMPIAAKIAEAVEMVSERLRGAAVTARFDFSEHSTMQQVRAERVNAGVQMHERGVPWNVINDHLRLGLGAFPGWDKAWLPFSLSAVGEEETDGTDGTDGSDGAKACQELETLLRGCDCSRCNGAAGAPQAGRKSAAAEARRKRAEAVLRLRAPWVRRARTTVDRALFEARKETLANIAAAEQAEAALRSGAFDFIFDIARFLELLVGPLMKVFLGAHQAAGDEMMKEMDSEEAFQADPKSLELLRARENFIKDAGQEVWEEIRNSIEEGVQAGESYEKLAARVRDKFNGLSKERSMRIAVTEVGIAQETARHAAMVQAGAEFKEWLTSGDERVRLTHSNANGVVIPIEQPFDIGGAQLMFPCDPNGPPSEIINCRCVHGPADDPAEGIIGNDPDPAIPF